MLNQRHFFTFLIVLLCIGLLPSSAFTQVTVPSSATADRVSRDQTHAPLPSSSTPMIMPDIIEDSPMPEGAKNIHFTLKSLTIEGAKAFPADALSFVKAPYLGKEITLDTLWKIAANITSHHRKHRYFLSRAYVPAQEIDNGHAIIRIANGYIAKITTQGPASGLHIVHHYTKKLESTEPLKADILESVLLRLNDIPGFAFNAVMEPLKDGTEGAIHLHLNSQRTSGSGAASFDNFGSRFLGPYQATTSYRDSFFDLHETNIAFSTSLPTDELSYIAIGHSLQFAPDWKLSFSANYVKAEPGSSLEINEIDSSAVELSLNLSHQLIRQRQENLSFSIGIDGKNTNSDILSDTPLTRDRIRAARAQLYYDTADHYWGYNTLNLGLHRGLEILGASNETDANLSRAEASPDFNKFTLAYTRQQVVDDALLLISQLSGQWADGPLYSAEEFGVGGQQFGRAYDPSEITGDHGFATSLELRYLGLTPWHAFAFTPYSFIDGGKVYNEDTGTANESAISAGFGVRVAHETGVDGNIGLAWPLTRSINLPVHGNESGPRLLMQFGYSF